MDLNTKKANLESQEDKISSLPDEVLIHILSFMSTRDAFRTNILSSRWENLWASVPNLSFRPGDGRTQYFTLEDLNQVYMSFIDRVLLLHNSSIHRFHLVCTPEIDKSRVNAWISTVVKRDVKDISISDYYCPNLQLPRSLFTCRTLEILKLDRHAQYNIPSSICFPRLKVLHVELTNPSKDVMEKLFCSSPVLEELKFEVEDDSGRSNYNISSPALKKLSIRIDGDGHEVFESVVTINSPVLELLEVFDDGFVRYALKNPSSIVKASVSVEISGIVSRLNNLYMLFKDISGVRSLTLDFSTMTAFQVSTEKTWPVFSNATHLYLELIEECFEAESLSKWPSFPNLRHLQLNGGAQVSSNTLSHLLTWAPNLVSLVFEKPLDEFDSSKQGVPACLRDCFKEIEIRKVEGWWDEMEQIKYLLESAQVLERLTIELLRSSNFSKEEVQVQILAMPRCSKHCQIVFV